jgi:hypothetical protein
MTWRGQFIYHRIEQLLQLVNAEFMEKEIQNIYLQTRKTLHKKQSKFYKACNYFIKTNNFYHSSPKIGYTLTFEKDCI